MYKTLRFDLWPCASYNCSSTEKKHTVAIFYKNGIFLPEFDSSGQLQCEITILINPGYDTLKWCDWASCKILLRDTVKQRLLTSVLLPCFGLLKVFKCTLYPWCSRKADVCIAKSSWTAKQD